jgi:hypothetical protein
MQRGIFIKKTSLTALSLGFLGAIQWNALVIHQKNLRKQLI